MPSPPSSPFPLSTSSNGNVVVLLYKAHVYCCLSLLYQAFAIYKVLCLLSMSLSLLHTTFFCKKPVFCFTRSFLNYYFLLLLFLTHWSQRWPLHSKMRTYHSPFWHRTFSINCCCCCRCCYYHLSLRKMQSKCGLNYLSAVPINNARWCMGFN